VKEETSLGVLRLVLTLLSLSSIALCIWTTITAQTLVRDEISASDLSTLEGERAVLQQVRTHALSLGS
jgi:hypothetical protein